MTNNELKAHLIAKGFTQFRGRMRAQSVAEELQKQGHDVTVDDVVTAQHELGRAVEPDEDQASA